MKVIMETTISIVMLLVASVLFSSIIGSFVTVNNARNYHGVLVECLENSNYDEEVMKQMQEDAQARGYQLAIEACNTKNGEPCYLVSVAYEVSLPVFELVHNPVVKKGVIEGYASM